MNYRHLAREALSRATAFLLSKENHSLRYAALELRLCMEALTYDRAQAYRKEIPPGEMGRWQPRQLMKVLLDIDPTADSSYRLRIGEEPFPGGQPAEMHDLGAEKVFGLKELKALYDAVGSLLHMPTMKQIEADGVLSVEQVRERCQRAADALGNALSSSIWNFTLGNFASCECMECGKTVRRRFPLGAERIEAQCFHCKAEYDVRALDDGQVLFEPRMRDVVCPTENCGQKFAIWSHEIREGAHWHCKKCGKHYGLAYGVVPLED